MVLSPVKKEMAPHTKYAMPFYYYLLEKSVETAV